MTEALHKVIKAAAEVARERGVSFTDLGEATSVPKSTLSTRAKEEIGSLQYKEYPNDARYERALRNWIDVHTSPGGGASPTVDEGDTTYAHVRTPSPDITGVDAEPETDIEAIKEAAKRRYQQKHRRAAKKKRQVVRFDMGPVMIAFIGDQHFGNAGTDVQRALDEQKLICDTPGAYVWQMGDVVDNMIVGRLKKQNMKPSAPVWEQWELAKHYLEGFDDKLVAYVGGNHGAWTMQQTSVDYRRDICPNGVLFDGDDLKSRVRVGKHTFRVWTRHKWKGSSIYNQTHGQERAARFADPKWDFYIGAHKHTGAVYREFVHEGRRKAAIQIGTYKVHDDYALQQGFPEHNHSTGCAVILHDDGSFCGMSDLEAACHYMRAVYT